MATLKKYKLDGSEAGEVAVADSLANAQANGQMIKDYIVALRRNARQWSANTLGRGEVACTRKKPHRQKGTGRARQGQLSAPQFRGGGIVFGPRPKFDQFVGINRKERRTAIRALLGEMIRESRITVLDTTEMEAPKTKTVVAFLKACNLDGRTLFLGEGNYQDVESEGSTQKISVRSQQHTHFIKSVNNVPKAEFALARNISGYDVARVRNIVMTEAALTELTEWLQSPEKKRN